MESPLVSIIVPIYNAAMDMVPCLESIKRQRYQNLEVLLVNDGSSDASLEICRMYARLDPRVIIIDKENTGVSGTRNAAIERAREKIVFGPGAKQRERTDDLAADLRGADASVQIKKRERNAARRERAAFKIGAAGKIFFDGFREIPPRRRGIGREKIKHMGSMPSGKHYM